MVVGGRYPEVGGQPIRYVFAFRGVSGSGKTTAVENLLRPGDIVIDHDHYMVDEKGAFRFDQSRVDACHEDCFSAYLSALQSGVKRIFLPMCLSGETRLNAYKTAAEESGYRFVSVVVEHRHNGRCVHDTPLFELKAQERRIRKSLKLLSSPRIDRPSPMPTRRDADAGDQEKQKVLWNASATAYQSHTDKYETHDRIARFLVSTVAVRPRTILDFGCGPGGSTRIIARAFPKASNIIAVDYAREMIGLAKQRPTNDPRITFCCCDFDEMCHSIRDRPVDLAVFSNSFFHVHHKEQLLCALKAILAPEGQIAFSMYESVFSLDSSILWPYAKAGRDSLMSELISRVRAAGFEITSRAEDREQFSARKLDQLFRSAGFSLRLAGILRLVRPAAERLSFFAIPAVSAEIFPNVPTSIVKQVIEQIQLKPVVVDAQERNIFGFVAGS